MVLAGAACLLLFTAYACGGTEDDSGTLFNNGGSGGGTSGSGGAAASSGTGGGQSGAAGKAGAAGVGGGGTGATAGTGGGAGWPTGGSGGGATEGGTDAPADVNFGYDAPSSDGYVEACAETVVTAEPLPLDLYFMLDTSGSMSGSNIDALHQGVVNFAQDASAAGIFVSGQQFAIGGYSETCNPADYANPAVPWSQLPYPQFVNWVNSLAATGYTPSVASLQGAVDACKARLASVSNHKCVVVFVTDGNPEGNCAPTQSAAQAPLGAIAADSCANGIPVFAIGFPNLPALGQGIINFVAQQGCTNQAFIIQSGSMGAQFTQQLLAIQQASLGCEFLMPHTDAGLIDIDQVKLTYTPGGGGAPQELPRVGDAGQCAGQGWYYDNNNNPSKLILCPDSCNTVKSDPNGQVNVELGCLGS